MQVVQPFRKRSTHNDMEKHMKYLALAILAGLLSGCIFLDRGISSEERSYWKADGTSYGYDYHEEEPIKGPDAVCYGTYAACEHAFNVPAVSATHYEPPVPPIDPNSNLAPPLDNLPGQ